jgi:hypothetical protein
MSQSQLCVSCAHLEERVSRRWYWCDKQNDWTSLATSCDEYAPPATMPSRRRCRCTSAARASIGPRSASIGSSLEPQPPQGGCGFLVLSAPQE